MGDVYRAARWTLVCLATEDRGTGWRQATLDAVLRKPSWGQDGGTELRSLNPMSRAQWVGLLSIMTSPWWSRAWVFQEFMLSREPIFLYRWSFIAWDDFDIKLERFFSNLPISLRIDSQISDLIRQGRTAREQVDRFLTRRDEFTSTGTNWLPGDKNFVDHFHPTSDLKGLLFNANFFNASDERDKIYAFLGLTDIPHSIIPDYSAENQMDKIYFEITKKLILHEDSLEALKYTWCSNDQTARSQSWVVSWTRLHSPKEDRLVFMPYKFLPKDWRADASFETFPDSNNVALNVWGVQLPPGLTYGPDGEVNDEAWVLYGLKVPVYLRRKLRRGCYSLVKAAQFIIDIQGHRVDKMPDVFNQVDSGKLERRKISII
jgi:hypothetical protein